MSTVSGAICLVSNSPFSETPAPRATRRFSGRASSAPRSSRRLAAASCPAAGTAADGAGTAARPPPLLRDRGRSHPPKARREAFILSTNVKNTSLGQFSYYFTADFSTCLSGNHLCINQKSKSINYLSDHGPGDDVGVVVVGVDAVHVLVQDGHLFLVVPASRTAEEMRHHIIHN